MAENYLAFQITRWLFQIHFVFQVYFQVYFVF